MKQLLRILLACLSQCTIAQDTLLLSSEKWVDHEGKPIYSRLFDYDKDGNELLMRWVDHANGDTSYRYKAYKAGRLFMQTEFKSPNYTVYDTVHYSYDGDTTFELRGNKDYINLTKKDKQGRMFYESRKRFMDGELYEHYVDSAFYDSLNTKITYIYLEYSKPPPPRPRKVKQDIYIEGEWLEIEVDNPFIEIPSIEPVNKLYGVVTNAYNKRGQITLLKSEGVHHKYKTEGGYTYDDAGRPTSTVVTEDDDTLNRTWTKISYEVKNDSVYGTSKHSSDKGYSVTVEPINSNQTEPTEHRSYSNQFGLISTTKVEFNEYGLPTKKEMWKNLEYTKSRFEGDKPIPPFFLRELIIIHYTYERFNVEKMD